MRTGPVLVVDWFDCICSKDPRKQVADVTAIQRSLVGVSDGTDHMLLAVIACSAITAPSSSLDRDPTP